MSFCESSGEDNAKLGNKKIFSNLFTQPLDEGILTFLKQFKIGRLLKFYSDEKISKMLCDRRYGYR